MGRRLLHFGAATDGRIQAAADERQRRSVRGGGGRIAPARAVDCKTIIFQTNNSHLRAQHFNATN